MSATIKVSATLERDETGEWEQFTWDLIPLVDATETLHLDTNGLPQKGTEIAPGMIIIGKIGKSHLNPDDVKLDSLDLNTNDYKDLRVKYGDMWRDTSVYATIETCGTVTDAFIDQSGSAPTAVVVIEHPNSPPLLQK